MSLDLLDLVPRTRSRRTPGKSPNGSPRGRCSANGLGPAGVCLAVVGTIVLGCAVPKGSGGASRPAVSTKLPSSQGECIQIPSVTSFRVIDRERILVFAKPPRVIQVFPTCEGLRFAEDIALSGSGGRVCDYRRDAILVDGQRCSIAAITPFEAESDARQRRAIEEAIEKQEREEQEDKD